MSLLLRVQGFYLLKKQGKNYHKIVWIAEIAASKIVADRKGNAFTLGKNDKKKYAFCCYHCHLSILALLSIEIIDSLAACRVHSIS